MLYEVITALVQTVAVELSELVLPKALPLGEHQLLELAVRGDQRQGGPGLETDPSLDAERGFAKMDVSADAEATAVLAKALDESRSRRITSYNVCYTKLLRIVGTPARMDSTAVVEE